MQNARLFDQRNRANLELEQSDALKSALLKMVKTLSCELDLKKCVREIMQQTRLLLQVDICTMFICEWETHEMTTYNFDGDQVAALIGPRVPLLPLPSHP